MCLSYPYCLYLLKLNFTVSFDNIVYNIWLKLQCHFNKKNYTTNFGFPNRFRVRIVAKLEKVYGSSVPSKTQIWYKAFKADRDILVDMHHCKRASTPWSHENLENKHEVYLPILERQQEG